MISERHVVPLVAIDLWVQAGAREEKATEFGSAHFLEHVLFKGTLLRPLGQTDIDIENLGGTLNAATGPDYTHFYTTVAASKVPQALDILADLVQNAAMPDAEVARERGVILDELAQHDSNATAHLIDLLYAKAFSTNAYGRSPGGSPEAISLRERDTLAAFYHRVYQPERCTLVLAGDLTSSEAEHWTRRSFGAWHTYVVSKSGTVENAAKNSIDKTNENIRTSAITVPTLPSKSFTEFAAVPQALLGLAFPAPPARNYTMTTAALLAAEILGDRQQYGRLAAAKLTSSIASARFTPRRDSSLRIITAAQPDYDTYRIGQQEVGQDKKTQNESGIQREEEALRNIVSGLSKSPPTSSEIRAAKLRLLGKMAADQDTCAGLASAIGYAEITEGESPSLQKAHIQHLPASELQQFIQLYLTQPGLCIRIKPSPVEAVRLKLIRVEAK